MATSNTREYLTKGEVEGAAGIFPEEDESVADAESEYGVITDPITAHDLYTKPTLMGMPMTYLAVGVIYGGQGAILYPLYQLILESPQNYQNAISSVVALFWSFKIFYGFLSDSVAIRGKRRKPYLLFGWTFSIIMTAIQAIYVAANENTLYCFNEEGRKISTPDQVACPEGETYFETYSVGKDFNGNFFVALMFLTNFAYMFADVAADGLAVEYAHREPLNQRGRIQSYNYCMRFTTTCVMFLLTSFALNTPLYGGSFTVGMSISGYLWVLTAGQAVWLPFWWIMEEKEVDPKLVTSVAHKLGLAWQLLQNRAFAALMIFNVIFNCFTSVGVVGNNGLAAYWVGVSALQYNLSGIFQYVAVTLVIWINGKYFVQYSWRCLQSFGLITSTFMGLLSLMIVYNINRSPWFWVFTQVDTTILGMIGWMTAIWACNEMAPPGLEGTALALATTSNNAAISVSVFFRNLIGGMFPLLSSGNGARDYLKPEAEDQFAYNIYIVMAVNLFGLVFMWLLPYQKAQARRRFQTWGSSTPYGFVGIAIVSVAMFYGTSTNLATLFCPCSPTWGGSGCIEGTCTFATAGAAESGNTTNTTFF